MVALPFSSAAFSPAAVSQPFELFSSVSQTAFDGLAVVSAEASGIVASEADEPPPPPPSVARRPRIASRFFRRLDAYFFLSDAPVPPPLLLFASVFDSSSFEETWMQLWL